MFVLYAIPLGLVLGLLLGGRPWGLGQLRFRFGWLALLGLLAQVVLFADPVAARVGDLGVPLYVGSTAVVLGVIAANWRLMGLPIVALGAGLNLLAIVANGGYMPASAEAYAAQGRAIPDGYSNTKIIAEPAFGWLTDVIAMPSWLPLHNVISLGDVLIGVGIVIAIVAGMRLRQPVAAVAMESPATS